MDSTPQKFKGMGSGSRTMLMNIQTGEWDAELLKLFSVPSQILPQICDSSGVFGKTKGLDFLPDGIPIAGIAGDLSSLVHVGRTDRACRRPRNA